MYINCKGHLIDLEHPKVMGILNLTPDSFYDGGKYKSASDIVKQVEKMLNEGATFIDIGAYSSRPKAKHISQDEELSRLLSVLELQEIKPRDRIKIRLNKQKGFIVFLLKNNKFSRKVNNSCASYLKAEFICCSDQAILC